MDMPCLWAPIRAKQLSIAATARVIWLCACVRYWPKLGEVIRIGNVSPPYLNKDKDILLRKTKTALQGAGSPPSETVTEVISILDQLAPVLAAPEAFLDYAILFLKPLDNEDEKRKFAKIRPLEIEAFKPTAQEEIRNVSYFEISHPEMSTFPRSLRLFTISHPHCSSQQLSFGAMEPCLFHVYLLNLVYGQNDTAYLEFLEGKDPFVDHSIATYPGSSGAPIIMYFILMKQERLRLKKLCTFYISMECEVSFMAKRCHLLLFCYSLTFICQNQWCRKQEFKTNKKKRRIPPGH